MTITGTVAMTMHEDDALGFKSAWTKNSQRVFYLNCYPRKAKAVQQSAADIIILHCTSIR